MIQININKNIMKKISFLFAVMLIASMNAKAQSNSIKGDVNGDGKVTITDAVSVVNIILNGGSEENADKTPAGVEAVDLGLPSGLKWANMNVGASKPEDYGDYFAWGETEPQSSNTYNWSTYKWCNGSNTTLTKYCNNSEYGNNGFTDGKTVLNLEDDAARANWGGNWRMPTNAEFVELIDNTTSKWVTQNGVYGRKFTSTSNGNSIFLPAAGSRWDGEFYDVGSFGYCWSSTPSDEYDACALYFDSYYANWSSNYDRNRGKSVRAVR